MTLVHAFGQALFLAAGMFWQVGWSLVLGFLLSGLIQALVSKERMRAQLGRNGVREIALATLYGAASSSCSYAAAALSKTLFKRGAALIPSLAFLFSSTNLVVELGVVLYLLMGWQFTLAEWLGGIVLIVLMSALVRITYPAKLLEAARQHVDAATGHEHGDNVVEGATLIEKLRNPRTPILVAQNFAMDWSMLWKDLLAGFLIAGALSALVPESVWQTLFLSGAPAWLQTPANATIGALLAIITFVCSIGNVPMAAVLWASGISFGGVLSFLYADLIVLPLLDIYRRYYGWKMAAYIGCIFFVTMTLTGVVMGSIFGAFHAIPTSNLHVRSSMVMFSLNYTFWLNALFGGLAAYAWYLNRKHPMAHGCHKAHDESHPAMGKPAGN
ncbi:MAG: permease [Candidatus Eremiobacteraeota bacterium]|nr:permease [Candidatus Eremiobacteraeota bacterium]